MDIKDLNQKKFEARLDLEQSIQRALSERTSEPDEPAGFQGPGIAYGDEPPKLKSTEYLEAATGWVYSAVAAIADGIIRSLKLRLYRTNKSGDLEEVLEHPALDLLYKVNKWQTFIDHLWLTSQYMELTGEAPWFVDRGEKGTGDPQNIILLRPDKLFIKKASEKNSINLIAGYEYKVNGSTMLNIKPEELIFLKYPDPTNPFRGKGTLQAAARVYDIDNSAEEYNKRFFHNSARPDSLLISKKKLTETQRKDLRAQIKALYGGTKNAHKTAILEDEMDWKPMSLTQKDMEYLEQQRFGRDKILAIFRVGKSIVSITEDVNLANAKVAEYVFIKWTIKPKLERLVSQLNEFYLPMFSGTEQMFLSFDDPVPQDVELATKKYDSALGKGYMTINEVRAELNLPDIGPDGDVVYVPNSIVPIDQAGQTGGIFPAIQASITKIEKKDSGKEANRKGIIARSMGGYYKAFRIAKSAAKISERRKKMGDKITKITNNIANGIIKRQKLEQRQKKKEWEEDKKSFVNNTVKAYDRYEGAFLKATKLIAGMQAKKILSKFPKSAGKTSKAKQIDPDDFLLSDEDTEIMVRVYDPMVRQLVKEQGARAAYLIGQGKTAFDMTTKPVQRYLKNRAFEFSDDINDDTNDQLGKTLSDGVKNGEGVPDLKKRVQKVFDDLENYRAERIARSEVVRASNFASTEAYEQSGVVSKVQWLTTEDSSTCEWCEPMDGKTIELGGSFFEEGDKFKGREGGVLDLSYGNVDFPPLHPNCRCTVVPIIN